MKKASLAVLVSLSTLAGAAYAQTDTGVKMSTDPAKAADVEQRAQALQTQQETMPKMEAPMHHKATAHHHKKAMKKEATPADGASQ
jgi:hypothetical protein